MYIIFPYLEGHGRFNNGNTDFQEKINICCCDIVMEINGPKCFHISEYTGNVGTE